MRRFVVVLIVVVAAGYLWRDYTLRHRGPVIDHVDGRAAIHDAGVAAADAAPPSRAAADSPYRCDGRTRCGQMHSCEEAKYFLDHCPNTEMDGDHDGVPCERQWCN